MEVLLNRRTGNRGSDEEFDSPTLLGNGAIELAVIVSGPDAMMESFGPLI